MPSKGKAANTADIVQRKLARLHDGGMPRVLDLFSGCGGISLGFKRAGCEIVGGVESDPHAARSHAINFHGYLKEENPALFEVHAAPKDITTESAPDLVRSLGYDAPESVVDILVGGPPCPAFARVGRAKLREVHEHPEAYMHDPRAKLYLPYLEYVAALSPVAIFMENVPDILNFGGHNLAEEICEVLEEDGYECQYTLLNAANYGVPQMRERFFLIGIHESVGARYRLPSATRRVEFPSGYISSRQVALKHTQQNLFERSRYVEAPPVQSSAGPVTVEEALADLPEIVEHLKGTMKRGARKFDVPRAYRSGVEPSAYANDLRNWPEFAGNGVVYDHVTRSLSTRDFRLFEKMTPGDEYPKAHALANRLFEAELQRIEREEGRHIPENSEEHADLKKEYVPPYDPTKFPNKWRKMEPDQPARTLMAHLGKDSYSHIHYDAAQARVLSVREAARLQSFPDGFVFAGTMNPAFRQIGNAVPPLLAYQLAQSILATIVRGIDDETPMVSIEQGGQGTAS